MGRVAIALGGQIEDGGGPGVGDPRSQVLTDVLSLADEGGGDHVHMVPARFVKGQEHARGHIMAPRDQGGTGGGGRPPGEGDSHEKATYDKPNPTMSWRSFSVMVGRSTITPGRFMFFFSPST